MTQAPTNTQFGSRAQNFARPWRDSADWRRLIAMSIAELERAADAGEHGAETMLTLRLRGSDVHSLFEDLF
jgi:hypothetical protein